MFVSNKKDDAEPHRVQGVSLFQITIQSEMRAMTPFSPTIQ